MPIATNFAQERAMWIGYGVLVPKSTISFSVRQTRRQHNSRVARTNQDLLFWGVRLSGRKPEDHASVDIYCRNWIKKFEIVDTWDYNGDSCWLTYSAV